MKFHTAILQPNGRVTGKECRDSEAIRSDAISQRMMDQFQRLLRENLGDDPVRGASSGRSSGTFATFSNGSRPIPCPPWEGFSSVAKS